MADQTPDPWRGVQPFKLMLLSDLQSGATEATLYHADDVDRARAAEREQHQREIADLIRAQDEEARRRIGGHPTCYSGEEIALADTVCFTSDVTLALGQRDETIRQLEAQIATLTQERGEAMKVLAPNMPESGLIDACRQVKQVAVSEAGNSTDWMNRAEAAEARCAEVTKDVYAYIETAKRQREWKEAAEARCAMLTAALRGLLSEAAPQMCLNDHCGCTEQTALKKARAALAAAPQGGKL